MEKEVEENPFVETRAPYLVSSLSLWYFVFFVCFLFLMAAGFLDLFPLKARCLCPFPTDLAGLVSASTSRYVASWARS